MKTIPKIALILCCLVLASCGNRKTEDTSIEMTEEVNKTFNELENDEAGDSQPDQDEQIAIAEAKMAVRNYYDALGRQEYRDAYEMMDKESRGAYEKFEEVNIEPKEIIVNFLDSEDPQVTTSEDGAEVTLPLQVSEVVSASNEMRTLKGTITVVKSKTKTDDKFVVTDVNVSEPESY
ncbi:MAG: hypothetical protein WBG71_01035 [Leeuwenhoekiella sp.]